MQNAVMSRTATSSATRYSSYGDLGAATCPHHCELGCGANHQFTTMLEAYDATGGLARVEELVSLFERCAGPSVATLANWIERREVVYFEWHADIWLPWFQFHRLDLRPHPQLAPLLGILQQTYSPWETANWFARPNEWLGGHSPITCLLKDLAAVQCAAQVDCLIANGFPGSGGRA